MSLVHPKYDPPRVYTLKFVDETKPWQTLSEGTNVGYLGVVQGCVAGAVLEKRAPWRESRCTCPTDSNFPTTVDDCRLTDPDVDKSPGVALQLEGPINGIDHVVRREESEFVLGTIDTLNDTPNKRHTAKFKPNEKMAALQCSGRRCEEVLPTSPCYADFNPAVFESIPEEFDCEDILSEIRAEKLLVEPKPLPTFPTNCPTEAPPG